MRPARGFSYALEALRAKRGWELDAARDALALGNARLDAARRAHEALCLRFAAARADWVRRESDAAGLVLAARWIADLGARIAAAAAEVRRLEAERARAAERLIGAQAALEAVERHREEMVHEHAHAALRAQHAAADEAWLQRASARQDA